jgi:hypothetical protein
MFVIADLTADLFPCRLRQQERRDRHRRRTGRGEVSTTHLGEPSRGEDRIRGCRRADEEFLRGHRREPLSQYSIARGDEKRDTVLLEES